MNEDSEPVEVEDTGRGCCVQAESLSHSVVHTLPSDWPALRSGSSCPFRRFVVLVGRDINGILPSNLFKPEQRFTESGEHINMLLNFCLEA